MIRYLRRCALVLVAALPLSLVACDPQPAAAGPAAIVQEIPSDATAVAPVASLTLSAFTIYMIINLLIPVAQGLMVRLGASTKVKQIAGAFFAAAVGLITTGTQLDGTALISLASLQYAGLTWLVSTAMYLAIYEKWDINSKLLPNRGIHFGTDTSGP